MAEASRETSPLDPIQLSKDELKIIEGIESRLAERPARGESLYQRRLSYLQQAEIRHPRVMLLDGGRGYREDIVAAHACEALALQIRKRQRG